MCLSISSSGWRVPLAAAAVVGATGGVGDSRRAHADDQRGLGTCQVVQWIAPTRVQVRVEAETAERIAIDDDNTTQPAPLPQASGASANAVLSDQGFCFCIDDITDYHWSSQAAASAQLAFQPDGNFRMRWTSDSDLGAGCSNALWCGCGFVDPDGCIDVVSPNRGETLSEFEAPFQILAPARVRVRIGTSEEFGSVAILNSANVNQINPSGADQTVILQPGAYRFRRTAGQATGAGPCFCESSDGEGEGGQTNGAITITLRDQADLNCDGFVSTGDIGPFVMALAQPSLYMQQFPACNRLHADMNCDGAVTVADIARFVHLIAG